MFCFRYEVNLYIKCRFPVVFMLLQESPACPPDKIYVIVCWRLLWSFAGMILTEDRSTPIKASFNITLSTTDLTWTGPWSNRGIHGDSPTTNHPNCAQNLLAEMCRNIVLSNVPWHPKDRYSFKFPRLLPRLDEVNDDSGRWEQLDKARPCPCNYLFPSNITFPRRPSSKAC